MSESTIQLDDLMFEYPLDRVSLQGKLPTYKEFDELKLASSETPVYGKPFKHQEFLVKFMQIVDSVLLMDATGSGKTGSFQHTSEFFRDHPEFGINKVFMITKNVQLVEWMKESLVSITNPMGYPEFNDDSNKTQMGRKKKLTQFLSEIGTLSSGETRETPYRMFFSTYATFVNKHHNMRNIELLMKFTGSLLIVDEVHRILARYITKSEVEEYARKRESIEFNSGEFKFDDARSINDIYLFIHWLCVNVPRMKKIFSSATPIINQLTRIQSILNLVRIDKQLYMDKSDWIHIGDTRQSINYLKSLFRGYIAYTREFDNNVVFNEIGSEIVVKGDRFTMMNLEMVPGGIQEETYLNSSCNQSVESIENNIFNEIEDDEGENRSSGLCISQRQISMFVYPNGDIEDNGKWTTMDTKVFPHMTTKTTHIKKGAKTIKFRAARKSFNEYLEDMNKLKELSVRFWFILKLFKDEDRLREQQIMSSRSMFLFMLYVNNSIEIFGMILKAHGYKQYYMREGISDRNYDYKRYAIITADTDSAEKTSILTRMNSPDNYDGKLIRVVCGSSTVIEGISFRGVTLYGSDAQWIDAEEYQAQTRILRATSHNDMTKMLLRSDPELNKLVDSRGMNGVGYNMLKARHDDPDKIKIDTYIFNSYPSTMRPNETIEARVQASSRRVGRKIGRITRAFKEIAVNCNLNEARNKHRKDKANTRNCDYMSCKYSCDVVVPSDKFGINMNNYRILNMESNITNIIQEISKLLIAKPVLRIDEIYEHLKTLDLEQFLLNSLERIISSNLSTYNRFGDQGYIRSVGDVIFFSKDYERIDYLPSTWTDNGLNIKTSTNSENWLLNIIKADKTSDYSNWILNENTEYPPEDVYVDLTTMKLITYFELLVDMYFKMVDNLVNYPKNDPRINLIKVKYDHAMKRLSYHYAGYSSDDNEPLLYNLIGYKSDGAEINSNHVINNMDYLFHAISVFRIGSIRFTSNENDWDKIRNNMRVYSRNKHVWVDYDDRINKFVNILRDKRVDALDYYISESPFVRVVIPDNVVRYVKKKKPKEKRVSHGIVCSDNKQVDGWLADLGYRGNIDDRCDTLVAYAGDIGKLIYT